jgi:type II secretory pathway pseudopilin PulG
MEVLIVAAILVILAGVGAVMLTPYLERAKEKTAKAAIMQIDQELQRFYITNNDYPADLVTLTVPQDGKPAAFDQNYLIDPWHRPYGYEPQNRHPSTGKPLVYSDGATPGNAQSRITNW